MKMEMENGGSEKRGDLFWYYYLQQLLTALIIEWVKNITPLIANLIKSQVRIEGYTLCLSGLAL